MGDFLMSKLFYTTYENIYTYPSLSGLLHLAVGGSTGAQGHGNRDGCLYQ